MTINVHKTSSVAAEVTLSGRVFKIYNIFLHDFDKKMMS